MTGGIALLVVGGAVLSMASGAAAFKVQQTTQTSKDPQKQPKFKELDKSKKFSKQAEKQLTKTKEKVDREIARLNGLIQVSDQTLADPHATEAERTAAEAQKQACLDRIDALNANYDIMENSSRNISTDITAYPAASEAERAEILTCIEEHKISFNNAKQSLDTLLADTSLSIAAPAPEAVSEPVAPAVDTTLATARTEAYTALGTSLETCHTRVSSIEEKREALTQRAQTYRERLETTQLKLKTCTDEQERQALEARASAYEKAIGSIERALQIPERHEQIMQDLTGTPVTATIQPGTPEQDVRNDTQFLVEITERVDAENAAYESLVTDLRAVRDLELSGAYEAGATAEEENDFPPPTA